jgi:RHS repeat-associated protein
LWQKSATGPNGETSLELFGQALSATHDYDPTTGVLKHIAAGGGSVTTEQDGGRTFANAIQSLGYTYFGDGKLKSRTDYGLEAAETFMYDNTDRVTDWTTSTTGTDVQYHYDDLGNLTKRDATGAASEIYHYGENNAGPHALTTGPLGTYSYDPSGRQTARPGQPVLSYTYFDLPTAVQRADGTSVTFEYDADGTRVVKSAPSATVTSIEGLYEQRVQGSTTTHVYYVPGDGTVIGQIACPPGGSSPNGTCQPPEFVHPDRLGTVDTVSSNGAAKGKEKRDPYGRSYNPANMSGPDPSITLGFIGAGEDSETGLINLNHRLYDAQLGRFISTDPLVKDPLDGEEYNRYAYGSNNPLTFTDPSGLQSGPPQGAPPDQGPYNPPPPPPPPPIWDPRYPCPNGQTCTWYEVDPLKAGSEASKAAGAAAESARPKIEEPFQSPSAPPNSLAPGGTRMPPTPTFNSRPSPSQDFINGAHNGHNDLDLGAGGRGGSEAPRVPERGPQGDIALKLWNRFFTWGGNEKAVKLGERAERVVPYVDFLLAAAHFARAGAVTDPQERDEEIAKGVGGLAGLSVGWVPVVGIPAGMAADAAAERTTQGWFKATYGMGDMLSGFGTSGDDNSLGFGLH